MKPKSSTRPSLAGAFPLLLAHGVRVQRFSKHCPHCRHRVTASHMQGEAVVWRGRGWVAARAQCPLCHARFNVTCVILPSKQVHRIVLPRPVLALTLAGLRLGQPRVSAPVRPQPVEAEVLAGLRAAALEQSGEILGQYQGVAIPAWVQAEGRKYRFDRPAPRGAQEELAEGELLLAQCLVYRRETSVSTRV